MTATEERARVSGAQLLLETLIDRDVTVCFANPGTSEMHFVAALDAAPALNAVLTLSEGVAAGAADGYARIAGRPAAVLLHLGPGLGNAIANLHNARRAGVPVVVIVGDHATHLKVYDSPLESDIDGLASVVSAVVRRVEGRASIVIDIGDAIDVALGPPAGIATLILPADVSWSTGVEPMRASARANRPERPDDHDDGTVLALLREPGSVLLIGGDATSDGSALQAAAQIAACTGARLLCETFPARITRGAGLPVVERLGYFAEQATSQFDGASHVLLVGARAPIAFFAYPNRPSRLIPADCRVHPVATAHGAAARLVALAADLPVPRWSPPPDLPRPSVLRGTLTATSLAASVAAYLPHDAIVVDESVTAGPALWSATENSPRHDWLTLTGGAIGYGLPAAVGAAIAAPERPVLCLQADGSSLYTIAALWTHVRQHLDITTVILNNGAYDILGLELTRVVPDSVTSASNPRSVSMLRIDGPRLNFADIAAGMGMSSRRVTTAEEFTDALRAALDEPGPHLIDALIGPQFVTTGKDTR